MAGVSLCKSYSALALALLMVMSPVSAQDAAPPECVILLHGLARTKWSMNKLAHELASDYQVVNNTYPSRRHTIEELAKMAIEPAIEQCGESPTLHFVTHSLGGILVRQYLSEHRITKLGHVVMLGPPNQGSEIVDKFQESAFLSRLFSLANGPASNQLNSQESSKPKTLGPVDFSLGVIAGNKHFSPFLARLLPDENDGKVTVESSKVEGMIDHLVMPVSHTFMMRDTTVIKQVKSFLAQGSFVQDDQAVK